MAKKDKPDSKQTKASGKPSSLIDTRVIYCGDNLVPLRKFPDGCVDLDSFEDVMIREDSPKGSFVSLNYSSDALSEIQSFFKKTGKTIIALTVKDSLEEQIAYKLA